MAYGDNFFYTEWDGFIIETNDIGTFITADPKMFDTEDIFRDKYYFVTKDDNAKVRKYMDKKLGYDWVEEHQVDDIDFITINEGDVLVDALHIAIIDVLGWKILNEFNENYKVEE